jgi:outer membrane protein assembly factor BamB
MGLEDCRFDVSRTDTTLKLEARRRPLRGVGASVRFGSLALLVAWPAAFAILAPRGDDTVPTTGFFVLAGIAAIANLLHAVQTRLFATPVLGRVRRSLIIETAPEDGPHRRAPGGPKVTIDGQLLDRGDRPRVALSTSVVGKGQTASTNLMARYHVSLVLRQRVIRVETFKDLFAAFELAEKLAEALDADAGTIEPVAEVPFEGSAGGVAIGTLGVVAQLVAAGAAIAWATTTDRIDGVSHALALAGVATVAFALTAQEASFHFLIAAVADSARKIHGVAPGEVPLRRRAWGATLAWIAGAIGVAAVFRLDTASPVARGRFELGGDRLALFDVNQDGVLDAIGLMDDATGKKRLVALDGRTGKSRWSREVLGSSVYQIPGGPWLLVGSGRGPTTVRVESFDPGTGEPRWKAELPDDVLPPGATVRSSMLPRQFHGAAQSGGCLLIHTRTTGTGWINALDPDSGKACSSMRWIDGPDGPAAEWHLIMGQRYRYHGGDHDEHAPPDATQIEPAGARDHALEPLVAEEKAREANSFVQVQEHRRTLVDGVTYDLRGTGRRRERLTLTASRDAVTLWSTVLDAWQIPELPFAVLGDDIVVAGVGLHDEDRLRLIGIDAATGAIRYVRRHPAPQVQPTDVALTGRVALVAWGAELRGYRAVTGELLWSTEGAEGAVTMPVLGGVVAESPAPSAPDPTRTLNHQGSASP